MQIKRHKGASTMKMLPLLAFFSLLICCKAKEYKIEIKDNDNASEWLNDYMVNKNSMFIDVEEFPYAIIEGEFRDGYIKKLNDKQYYILDNEEYFLLTGQILKKKHGLAIRGVFSQLDGWFSVTKNIKNEYMVIYIVGGITSSYNKTVLIIETDELPLDIYICLGGGGA